MGQVITPNFLRYGYNFFWENIIFSNKQYSNWIQIVYFLKIFLNFFFFYGNFFHKNFFFTYRYFFFNHNLFFYQRRFYKSKLVFFRKISIERMFFNKIWVNPKRLKLNNKFSSKLWILKLQKWIILIWFFFTVNGFKKNHNINMLLPTNSTYFFKYYYYKFYLLTNFIYFFNQFDFF